jgi:hypothetical protein
MSSTASPAAYEPPVKTFADRIERHLLMESAFLAEVSGLDRELVYGEMLRLLRAVLAGARPP